MFTFWCTLPNGQELSVSTSNLQEAPRRARALGACKLFGKNRATGKVFELSL
jgi:hypothetical protein